MTWVEHHRRDQALRTVVELADRRRDGLLPWDEIADAREVFGTPDRPAAPRCRCAGTPACPDRSTPSWPSSPMTSSAAVVHAWRYAAADLPGLRAILDANLDHPVIAAGRRKELALLATAAALSWSR